MSTDTTEPGLPFEYEGEPRFEKEALVVAQRIADELHQLNATLCQLSSSEGKARVEIHIGADAREALKLLFPPKK